MKKIGFALLLILTLVASCGCEGYINSYSAMMLITSCYGDEASMEFDSFEGTYNFKLRRDGEAESTLEYEADLDEGQMNVYIGTSGERELLFTVNGGESYDTKISLDDKYANEETVHIILESVGKCGKGEFEFEYN